MPRSATRIATHPGEFLLEEFLKPFGVSATAFAKMIGVPPNRVTEIIRGRRDVTADTAIRFGKALRTTPEFWLNLQRAHDLSKAASKHDYRHIRVLKLARAA
jgi:antitoxin HigA-1